MEKTICQRAQLLNIKGEYNFSVVLSKYLTTRTLHEAYAGKARDSEMKVGARIPGTNLPTSDLD